MDTFILPISVFHSLNVNELLFWWKGHLYGMNEVLVSSGFDVIESICHI